MSERGESQSQLSDAERPSESDHSAGPSSETRPAVRSRLVAALLSSLWPGLGQLYGRRRVAAAVFATPVLLVAVWLTAQLANGLDYFGASLLDDSFALTVVVLVGLMGAWRIGSIVHAYSVAGPRRRPPARDAAIMALLLVVVVGLHGAAMYNAWAVYGFDTSVSSNQLISDVPTAVPSDLPTGAPTGAASASPSSTPIWTPPAPTAPSEPTPSPSPTPSPTQAPSTRVSILLTGTDFLAGRTHAMNDSLLIASLDMQTHKVAILSLPRDTANYDFYWGGKAGYNTKINNFANLVATGQIHAPDPPATALAKEVGWLVGLNVGYYVIVDIAGFGKMVDAANGVCVTNPRAINDPSTGTFIPAGNQCFDGHTALKYVRSREGAGDSDYTRSRRQQDVLIALARKLSSAAGIGYLAGVLSVAGQNIQTNFPLKTVRNYVSIARQIGPGDISQCVLGPPYNYHPDSAITGGAWTSRLKMDKVAQLSVYLFGTDSRFFGTEGITPAPCGK